MTGLPKTDGRSTVRRPDDGVRVGRRPGSQGFEGRGAAPGRSRRPAPPVSGGVAARVAAALRRRP